MESLIQIQNVSKRFRTKEILSGVTLDIGSGDSIAITGHNGSGKSTLLKLIAGLLPYDSGKIFHSKKLKMAYIPEHFPKLAITPRQYFKHMGRIEGIDKCSIEEGVEKLSCIFYMQEMLDTPIRFLSKGTMQKVCVIQAMLSKADVLLLDEPLSGQDLDSQKNFISLVKEQIANGVAVVMSCHEPFLIEELAKEIYQIKDRRLVRTGVTTSSEIKKRKRVLFEGEKNHPIVVSVEEENMSRMIYQMLGDGYQIRGIEDEKE